MSTVTEAVASANESVLTTIAAIQDRVLDVNRDIAASYSKPSVPSWVPTPDPATATDVVEQAFEFRSKLVEADKDFVLRLVEVWTPVAKASGAKK
jgi:hypothetical protein